MPTPHPRSSGHIDGGWGARRCEAPNKVSGGSENRDGRINEDESAPGETSRAKWGARRVRCLPKVPAPSSVVPVMDAPHLRSSPLPLADGAIFSRDTRGAELPVRQLKPGQSSAE
jgi:hypothetical protein